ncbi:response regulator transcription factor [Marinomonas mediterranea]|uniref:response regulator transcription factor n=1 Tax=Marinomonas mediterranea TaxID=119864 RepID=UPI0023499640|nr:response regulator transcription factor [Marinomonas mediterranea]WCN08810.1 DNA-binding response regulator [Marinomonas mediterranea]
MNILCWNTDDAIWQHWAKVMPLQSKVIRVQSSEEVFEALNRKASEFEYCFVFLGDENFSRMVEDVVAIKIQFSDLKLIAFPNRSSQDAALRMLSNGVNGQCNPYIAQDQLALVLSVVDSGEIWGGKVFIQQLIKQTAQREHVLTNDTVLDELSDRERDVALFIAKGLTNKQIAGEMDIVERTVKAHLTAIFKKLNVKDRLALALLVQG